MNEKVKVLKEKLGELDKFLVEHSLVTRVKDFSEIETKLKKNNKLHISVVFNLVYGDHVGAVELARDLEHWLDVEMAGSGQLISWSNDVTVINGDFFVDIRATVPLDNLEESVQTFVFIVENVIAWYSDFVGEKEDDDGFELKFDNLKEE